MPDSRSSSTARRAKNFVRPLTNRDLHHFGRLLSGGHVTREGRANSKLIQSIEQLSFLDLTRHKGTHLEKLNGLFDPRSGEPLYSLRITLAARALAIVPNGALVLLVIRPDHDNADRKH
jgi:hypothetical protein